jgi:hypothetical protein
MVGSGASNFTVVNVAPAITAPSSSFLYSKFYWNGSTFTTSVSEQFNWIAIWY